MLLRGKVCLSLKSSSTSLSSNAMNVLMVYDFFFGGGARSGGGGVSQVDLVDLGLI